MTSRALSNQTVEPRVICNRDDRGRCNANDGEPCAKCEEARVNVVAYWRRRWSATTYEAELRDAGRGVR